VAFKLPTICLIFSFIYTVFIDFVDFEWYYLWKDRRRLSVIFPEPMVSMNHPVNPKASASDRILHAAKTLFAQAGFENTSTISIARLAQTSESQIIKHFGNKEGLLEAIFEEGWKHIGEAFGALEYVPSPSSKLQALA
jgi:hypothetical protein